MAHGDHVFVRRFGGVYTHHGIDRGDGVVIHYTGDSPLQSKVRRTSTEAFVSGGELEVRDYTAVEELLSATENPAARVSSSFNNALDRLKGLPETDGDRSPSAVIARAESRMGETRFDFTVNNCEHFATWCKTGLSGSTQIESMWRAILTPPEYFRYSASNRMVDLFQMFGWNR